MSEDDMTTYSKDVAYGRFTQYLPYTRGYGQHKMAATRGAYVPAPVTENWTLVNIVHDRIPKIQQTSGARMQPTLAQSRGM